MSILEFSSLETPSSKAFAQLIHERRSEPFSCERDDNADTFQSSP